MTIAVWPIDAVPAVPGRALREAHSAYLAGASAADPFGVRSGVRPGTSPTTVTATSTTWTVGAHAGVLDLQSALEASGYAYAVNATGGLPTGAVTAADATRPRIDLVWVRNDDPSEGDGSAAPTVVFGYTAGAPLAVPVAPATPARCMVLATLQVPMSGGGAPTVIWAAPYAVAAGVLNPAVTASLTTNSAAFSTGAGIILDAPSITGDGAKKFKITVSAMGMSSNVAGDRFDMKIQDSTTGIYLQAFRTIVSSTLDTPGISIVVTDVPAAGPHVYRFVGLRVAGTGTAFVYGAATTPIQIIVEQIA